jgi:DNA-binding FadR family transcriptional regulator
MVRESKHHHNPLDADRLFHVRIAEASGNSALVLVVQTLWDQRVGPLYRSLKIKLEYPQMADETVREHQAIVSAIARRDPRAARAAMRDHMDRTHNRYIKEWSADR